MKKNNKKIIIEIVMKHWKKINKKRINLFSGIDWKMKINESEKRLIIESIINDDVFFENFNIGLLFFSVLF